MAKQVIRLNESQLHNLIKESVKRVLREIGNDNTQELDADDVPSLEDWGDYEGAPSAEEQWEDLDHIQKMGYDTYGDKITYAKPPKSMYGHDANSLLDQADEAAFPRDNWWNNRIRKDALDKKWDWTRRTSNFNGSKHIDQNNPGEHNDPSLPEEFANLPFPVWKFNEKYPFYKD